jgi:hypothetical protein
MVSEAFVRRYFSGRDALGAWIRVAGRERQIVGVVEDGPTIHLQETIQPYFYFPFAQMPMYEPTFFVESAGDAGALAVSVRSMARRVDAEFILRDMHTLREHMFTAHEEESVLTGIAGTLALPGLVLAAGGLFGVTSYAVSRRMREFGLRVALGARGTDLHRQVLKKAAVQAAIGIPLGWAMAFGGRQLLESVLYGVKAGNPWVLAGASGLVALVALLAALRPAFVAARVDPMVALRYE